VLGAPAVAHLDGSSVLPAVTPMVSVVGVTARATSRHWGGPSSDPRPPISQLRSDRYDDASRDRSAEIAGAAPGFAYAAIVASALRPPFANRIRAARGQLMPSREPDCVVDVGLARSGLRVFRGAL